MTADIVDGRYLEVLVRAGDVACERVVSVVLGVAARWGIAVHVVDVGSAPDGYEEYVERVPVVRGPNAVVIAEGRISASRITQAVLKMTGGDTARAN